MTQSEKNSIIPGRQRSFSNRIQQKLDEANFNWPGYLGKLSQRQMQATISCIMFIDQAYNLDDVVHELAKLQDFLILSLTVTSFTDERRLSIMQQIQILTTLQTELAWIRDYGCRRWM